ncbi:Hypothetical predicted protein [Lecanosticta acicola]|uniref:Uncharacterized protein n=1 Tax=Lecanosticta acicola TaxID=111012 RepID=A0AAI9ECE6_9PEZI|nr:Hypothetical predicted protein [Lecanosticta acicola]
MDLPREGFRALEKAFERQSYHIDPAKQFKRKSAYAHSVPTTYADIPDSEEELVSPLSNDHDEPSNVTITPPPRPSEFSRHTFGLPPTPPTMTNSDGSEAKPHRALSPAPLFADRVRNALETQKSGHSTPAMGNQSPPTPDTSPPGTSENLLAPRPLLSHCPSSHADSFKTAHEGLSNPTSEADVPAEDEPSERERTWLENTRPLRWAGFGLDNDERKAENTDDSERGEVRVKHYQMESDSDMERPVSHRSNGNTAEEASPSAPTARRVLDHRAAYQRLRKPIQPGDDLKRPNESLLYGSSSVPWRGQKAAEAKKATPRREMDTQFLGNAKLVRPQTPESPMDNPSQKGTQDSTPRQTRVLSEAETPPTRLREFTPSAVPPGSPSPPNTAQKASLEENNKVYQMIQEENAKRHSAISDGSVQAKVVAVPQHKRKLRHMSKRASLRGDVSLASNEKRSSTDSGHKLRHKRTIRSTSPEPVFPKTPERSEPCKFSARISKFNPGENGYDYWSAVPDARHTQRKGVEANTSSSLQPSPELDLKPRRLRRSVRELDLDRVASLSKTADQARPWSMDGSLLQQSVGSPRLRRTSADRRLDKNLEVRRTSLGHELRFGPGGVDDNPHEPVETHAHEEQEAADEQAVPGAEASVANEQTSLRESRTSSVKMGASPRKTLDPRSLRSVGTPLSMSQFSDRTEAELCEARGVQLFPHNNDSLLLIQQASRAIGYPDAAAPIQEDEDFNSTAHPLAQQETLRISVEEPTDMTQEMGPAYTVDSPLTNPRAAPEPPTITFIPPTPNEELERPLGGLGGAEENPRKHMQRRPSLTQRVRRYSESLIHPLPFGRTGSVRKQAPKRVTTMPEQRPTHLSSFWQPRDFWDDLDSDEEDEFDDDDHYVRLPPGGDTSSIDHKRRKSLFPRNMSVRMPGFRGNGGFLVGNSLGINRHGTNNRRHYVERQVSHETLRRLQAKQKRRMTFTLPFSGGARFEYVGLDGLRDLMEKREQRALEKRREKLRGQIGTRVFHDDRSGVA